MAEAVHPDWSGLPEDLMSLVMRVLDIPDLFRAGAVCTSWYAAFSAVRRVRIPITDASPCLLYSCADDDDADTATLYSPATGASFKVRLPAPAFRSRHVVGSAHGWVVTADEASNLQLLNPLTGAQVDLPPVTGLHHVEPCRHGRPAYNLHDRAYPDAPEVYAARELRVIDPCLESYTDEMELYKVDVDGEKLVKISGLDLRGHALFLGFNSSMLLSTKDFPRLKPNCAYLTDDNWEQIGINMYGCRDIGVWNFETETLESLAALHSVPPWFNWPPPIWITPSLS